MPGKSKVIQLKNDNYCMSSNVNGVVRAVLNLFSFLRKDFTRTNTETQRRKSTKKYKDATEQKAQKAQTQDSTKQKYKSIKSIFTVYAF